MTDIGVFTTYGRSDSTLWLSQVVLNLANDFLHEGIPQRRLKAVIARFPSASTQVRYQDLALAFSLGYRESAAGTYWHIPILPPRRAVIRIYDHEVQGGTVVKPLTGLMNDGPSDGCVLKPIVTHGRPGESCWPMGSIPNMASWTPMPWQSASWMKPSAMRSPSALTPNGSRCWIISAGATRCDQKRWAAGGGGARLPRCSPALRYAVHFRQGLAQ